jgi:hypothetical protein
MDSDYDSERNQTQFPPEILGKPLNYYEYLDDRNKWAGKINPTVDSELS